MANAIRTDIPPVKPQYTVTLELTQQEAEVLLAITWQTGGDPNKTARRYTDSVMRALESVDVQAYGYDEEGRYKYNCKFTNKSVCGLVFTEDKNLPPLK